MNGITVLNPQGQRAAVQRTPLSPRLDSLAGKTVYIVDMRWPYTEQFTKELRNILTERYPGSQIHPTGKRRDPMVSQPPSYGRR